MRQEILNRLKEEYVKQKNQIDKYNKKIKRIKELEQDTNVSEYISLIGINESELELKQITDSELIRSFYRRYLCEIKEETNEIYVYLGTYKYSDEIDVIHGIHDIRINYNSEQADYRIYYNIEQLSEKNVPIVKCEEFEKNHIIINPKCYLKLQEFYNIQEEFFTRAIITDQEEAKKYILKKYDRL